MANRLTKFVRENITPTGRATKKWHKDNKLENYMRDEFLKYMGGSLLHERYGAYAGKRIRQDKDIFQPRQRLTFHNRNQIYIDSAITRTTIDKKTKELTRNGIGLISKFARKCMREHIEPCQNPMHKTQQIKGEDITGCSLCPNPTLPLGQEGCGEEFETEQLRCTECMSTTRPPKREHKRILEPIHYGYINKAKQSLDNIMFQARLDVEKHDNGFIVVEFLYTRDKITFEIVRRKFIQAFRGDPARIRPVHAFKSGSLTSDYYTCIRHREQYTSWHMDANYGKIPRCQHKEADYECNEVLELVEYVELETEFDTNPIYSFIRGEVFHAKEYSPASAMGVSLIDSLYYTIISVNAQEKWLAEYYAKRRMFKGIVQVPQGFAAGQGQDQQTRIDQEMKTFREDPDYIPWFGVPKDGKDLKFIRIDDSPKELQYMESREEGRRQVTNAFGMSNIWAGDASAGSGLNNQGLELTVSNRSVAVGQHTQNKQMLLPFSASIIGCSIDEAEYYFEYNQHEEQDVMAEKQQLATDIANHSQLQGMGFDIYMSSNRELYALPPVIGMPVSPAGAGGEGGGMPPMLSEAGGAGSDKPFANVEGMNEGGQMNEVRAKAKPFEGAPEEPRPAASGLALKSQTYLSRLYADIAKGDIAKNGVTIRDDLFGWLKPILEEQKGKPIKHFTMTRHHDVTGVSGTGEVVRGLVFGDGTTVIRWMTDSPSVTLFPTYEDFLAVHVTSHPENKTDITMGQGGDVGLFDVEEAIEPIKSSALLEKKISELDYLESQMSEDDKIDLVNRGIIVKVWDASAHPRVKSGESFSHGGKTFRGGMFINRDDVGSLSEADQEKLEFVQEDGTATEEATKKPKGRFQTTVEQDHDAYEGVNRKATPEEFRELVKTQTLEGQAKTYFDAEVMEFASNKIKLEEYTAQREEVSIAVSRDIAQIENPLMRKHALESFEEFENSVFAENGLLDMWSLANKRLEKIKKRWKKKDIEIAEVAKYAMLRGEKDARIELQGIERFDGESEEDLMRRINRLENFVTHKNHTQAQSEERKALSEIMSKHHPKNNKFKIEPEEVRMARVWYYENTSWLERERAHNGDLPLAPSMAEFKANPNEYMVYGVNDPSPDGLEIRVVQTSNGLKVRAWADVNGDGEMQDLGGLSCSISGGRLGGFSGTIARKFRGRGLYPYVRRSAIDIADRLNLTEGSSLSPSFDDIDFGKLGAWGDKYRQWRYKGLRALYTSFGRVPNGGTPDRLDNAHSRAKEIHGKGVNTLYDHSRHNPDWKGDFQNPHFDADSTTRYKQSDLMDEQMAGSYYDSQRRRYIHSSQRPMSPEEKAAKDKAEEKARVKRFAEYEARGRGRETVGTIDEYESPLTRPPDYYADNSTSLIGGDHIWNEMNRESNDYHNRPVDSEVSFSEQYHNTLDNEPRPVWRTHEVGSQFKVDEIEQIQATEGDIRDYAERLGGALQGSEYSDMGDWGDNDSQRRVLTSLIRQTPDYARGNTGQESYRIREAIQRGLLSQTEIDRLLNDPSADIGSVVIDKNGVPTDAISATRMYFWMTRNANRGTSIPPLNVHRLRPAGSESTRPTTQEVAPTPMPAPRTTRREETTREETTRSPTRLHAQTSGRDRESRRKQTELTARVTSAFRTMTPQQRAKALNSTRPIPDSMMSQRSTESASQFNRRMRDYRRRVLENANRYEQADYHPTHDSPRYSHDQALRSLGMEEWASRNDELEELEEIPTPIGHGSSGNQFVSFAEDQGNKRRVQFTSTLHNAVDYVSLEPRSILVSQFSRTGTMTMPALKFNTFLYGDIGEDMEEGERNTSIMTQFATDLVDESPSGRSRLLGLHRDIDVDNRLLDQMLAIRNFEGMRRADRMNALFNLIDDRSRVQQGEERIFEGRFEKYHATRFDESKHKRDEGGQFSETGKETKVNFDPKSGEPLKEGMKKPEPKAEYKDITDKELDWVYRGKPPSRPNVKLEPKEEQFFDDLAKKKWNETTTAELARILNTLKASWVKSLPDRAPKGEQRSAVKRGLAILEGGIDREIEQRMKRKKVDKKGRLKKKFEEAKHKRGGDIKHSGRFSRQGGSGSKEKSSSQKPDAEEPKSKFPHKSRVPEKPSPSDPQVEMGEGKKKQSVRVPKSFDLGDAKVKSRKLRQDMLPKIKDAAKKLKPVFNDEELALPKGANQPISDTNTHAQLWELTKGGQEQSKNFLTEVCNDLGISTEHMNSDISKIKMGDIEGGALFVAEPKGMERAAQKVEEDYNGDWSELLDTVRASIVVDDIEGVYSVIDKMREKGLKFARRPKDRINSPLGDYRDIMFNYELPNGLVAELQVHVKEMFIAKNDGHKHYDILRNFENKKSLNSEEQIIKEYHETIMNDLYFSAWGKQVEAKEG